jgi:hypothetical protein
LEEYTNGSLTTKYTYGDDLISQARVGLTSYYHYDGQLSTRQLTDKAENITDEYVYDAFGILIDHAGTSNNDFLYTGEQYDPNAGFYYLVSVHKWLTYEDFTKAQKNFYFINQLFLFPKRP